LLPARGGYALVFGLAYTLPGWVAQQQDSQAHIATTWDALIPLWPWAIVPYATSGLWLLLGFAALPDRAALRMFTHRLLLATVVAGVVFACWPLRFSGPRFSPTGEEAALLRLLWAGMGVWLYLAGTWALVAWAYACDEAGFLHKTQGRFPWWIVVLYGPYLAGYGLTWWAVRWRERHHPPCEQVAAGLWVGRRLSDAEARIHLPARCHLIDLANELPATPELLRHALSYQHLPLLDLRPIAAPQEISIFRAIQSAQQSGGPVYVHCAMGYARSRHIIAAYLAYLKSSFSSVS
jgi:rhodanese-related sulfurtransferase